MGSDSRNSGTAANVVGRRPDYPPASSAAKKAFMQDGSSAVGCISQHELEAFLDALPDMYVRLHSDGTVLGWRTSDERNLSALHGQAAGKNLADLLPASGAMQMTEAIRQVSTTHRPSRIEYTIPDAHGERRFEARLVRFGETDLIAIIREIPGRGQVEKEQDRLMQHLESAGSDLTKLGVLLPICSKCKRIRDDHGGWQRLEKYLVEHSGLQFTHSLCPQCARELYPEVFPVCACEAG